MKTKLLVSLVLVGLSGLAVGGGTMAYFMDIEVSEGNQFMTGAFDAVLEEDGNVYGIASNPEVPTFFSLQDAKPGDDYQKAFGLRVDTNDAWGCMAIERTADDDVSLLEPEMDAGDTDQGAGNGEVGASMGLRVWTDMGDGLVSGVCDASPGDEKFQPQCGDKTVLEKKPVQEGGSGLGTVQTELVSMPLSDSTTNVFTGNAGEPLDGTETYYIGINFSISEDAGNEIQTDLYESDLKFYTEQFRSNPDFNCGEAIDQEEGDSGTDGDATDSDGDGVADVNDCDPDDDTVYPGATEICDGKDNNCDGAVDESCSCNYNGISEGVCSGSTIDSTGSCSQPSEYESDETSCDNLDNDCDGMVDENCVVDADGDGYSSDQDCDDSDSNTYPGAAEEDSTTACMTDADGDGYGDASPGTGIQAGSDCDDSDPDTHPNATEMCDSIDNDCDGTVDEQCTS